MTNLSPARYVGGTLFVCERCGRETLNAPCACDKYGMVATITTTGAEATTYQIGNGYCPTCGLVKFGVGVECCRCPVEVSSVFGWASPARTAWECPRCHTINAPHVDRCACTE